MLTQKTNQGVHTTSSKKQKALMRQPNVGVRGGLELINVIKEDQGRTGLVHFGRFTPFQQSIVLYSMSVVLHLIYAGWP